MTKALSTLFPAQDIFVSQQQRCRRVRSAQNHRSIRLGPPIYRAGNQELERLPRHIARHQKEARYAESERHRIFNPHGK